MNGDLTASAPRSNRLRRRLVRHHLPLFVLSAALIAILSLTYRSAMVPRVNISTPQAAGQGGQHDNPGERHVEPDTGPGGSQGGAGEGGQPLVVRSSSTSPFLDAFTVASGYTALALVALTLLVGPLHLRRFQRVPISTDLRRDVGIWAALISLLHVAAGLQMHSHGEILRNFLPAPGMPQSMIFGWANWLGLAATLILLLLAGLSNDAMLQRLGAKRWKRLQRLNYLLFFLILVHSILYQIYHWKNPAYPLLLATVGTLVVVGQLIGACLFKTRVAAAQQREVAA